MLVCLWLLAACRRDDSVDTEIVVIEPGDTDVTGTVDTDRVDTDADTDLVDTDADTDLDTDLVDTDAVDTDAPEPDPIDTATVSLAVIGDYGVNSAAEADVAALVNAADPDVVVTTGDNNYPRGGADTIDDNIGKHYGAFIYPYRGTWGAGASENRFFPALGNHDWDDGWTATAYLDWFDLPGGERYYDVARGAVHLFVLDSDPREPDGVDAASVQAAWLEAGLAASTSPWNIVIAHHPPFSSSKHGSTADLQWPFAAWGADLVISGHDHVYERLVSDGIPYVVDGFGGASLYPFASTGPIPESVVQWDSSWGAMFIDADTVGCEVTAMSAEGVVIDRFSLGEPDPVLETLLPSGSTWRFLDDGSDPGVTWIDAGFDDSAWDSGPAPIGSGTRDLATSLASVPTTTWFRASVDVVDASSYAELRVGVARDDGAIVYLNGRELFRSNLPDTAVGATTTASRDVSGGSEDVLQTAWVSASALVDGANVVAVELHQAGMSVDAKLDLQLDAR
jgi:tartrate-resistant acid phosphatase type 5